MDAIQQAMAAAAAAKAATESAAPAQTGTSVANVPAQNMAMSAPVAPGPKLTMDTLSTGQMVVDMWLKPKEYGLLVGDKTKLFPKAKVVMDMTDGVGFIPKKGIKAGNPAQYKYTTDGVTCTSGGSWEAAVVQMKNLDSKAYEYRTVDLPFELLEDITVDGEILAKAGTKLGYTTSTTNWKAWEEFYTDVKNAGLLNEKVVVELGYQRRENANKNVWGIITFKLLGSAEAGE